MGVGFVPGVGIATALLAAVKDALDQQTIWRGPRVRVMQERDAS